MAAEVYRVEIPIIVEDQTEAPLQQAGQRVSRFEQRARRDIEATRRHFERVGKLRIEPIMRVRDKLTAGVLKADKLLRTLDAAQAAPVLAAQDRISAVVLRINRVLEALNRGEVDVLADLKGPLMEEINQARTALVALSKSQAAPVAELRGKLFGQLTRAMTVARQLDRVRAEPEATLRDRVTAKARTVMTTLRSLSSRVWTITLQAKDRVTSVLGRIGRLITSPLALLGAGVGGLGATAAIAYPLKLAGEMEQAQIAMEYFTESAERGMDFLKRLQAFAARTPFEFAQVRDVATGLMPLYKNMYSVEQAMDETIRTIKAFGDAAGFTGAGIEGMERALLGFRQIGTMGKLQMEELRQVTENLLIPMDIVLKELGLTGDALEDLGKRGISAKVAMEAIIRALEKNFAGGMEKMSQSLLGLVSTVKDTANLVVMNFGAGMAEPVRRILLDIVGWSDYTGEKFEAFKAKLQRAGREIGERFEAVYQKAKLFFDQLAKREDWQKADWAGKLLILIEEVERQVVPEVAEVGAKLGAQLGQGVIKGLWEAVKSDPLTAALLGAWIGSKVPGPAWVKLLVGGGIAVTPWVVKGAETATGYVAPKVKGTTAYTERKIAEQARAWTEFERQQYLQWEASRWLPPENRIQQPMYGGTSIGPAKRAAGGLFTRPHLALVAEAGPEAIIPLSTRMRHRALALWEYTGRVLGAVPELPRLVGEAAYRVNVAMPRLPELAGKALINPVLGALPRLPELVGRAVYRTTVAEERIKAHATGGIFARPHLGLMAEARPKAVIPLSARMRDRALGLWEETGRRLGAVPAAAPAFAGAVTSVNTGPVNVTFNVTATDGQDVLRVIRAHRKAIADEVARDIAEGLRIVSGNMPRR